MSNDRPVSHIFDVVDTESPLRHFAVFERSLSQLIRQYYARCGQEEERTLPGEHAFVLGIHGPWGSGKSTLMERVGAAVEKSADEIMQIRFDAWKYSQRQEVWRALLSRVAAAAEERDDRNVNAKKVKEQVAKIRETLYRDWTLTRKGSIVLNWKGLPKSALKAVLGAWKLDPEKLGEGFIEMFQRAEEDEFHAHLQDLDQFRCEFLRLQQATGVKWLVQIDDLDRCLPEQAIEVFEAIKVFLDVPGVAFVLALDKETIRRGLRVRYREIPGEKPLIDPDQYVEKVTNVAFTLPTLSSRKATESFIYGLIGGWESGARDEGPMDEERTAPRRRVDLDDVQRFAKLVEELLGEQWAHIEPNPRRWIRLVNTVLLYYHIWDGIDPSKGPKGPKVRGFDSDDLVKQFIKLMCLSYRWPGFMEAALDSPDVMHSFERAAEQSERDFNHFRETCAARYPALRLYAQDPQLFRVLLTEPKLAGKLTEVELGTLRDVI